MLSTYFKQKNPKTQARITNSYKIQMNQKSFKNWICQEANTFIFKINKNGEIDKIHC